jgi:hypothetical protein
MVSLVSITGHALVDEERLRRLTHQSTLREKVFEYALIGELAVELLERGTDFTVLNAWADRDGYDLVIESGPITRHIQLKTTIVGTTTRDVPINTRLAAKASGCVIWAVFDARIRRFVEYRWFGGRPEQPLPGLGDRAVRHTRANAAGIKAIRPDIRSLGLARFERLSVIESLADRLFGEAA